MSSINPHFTFNYSQPEEYRFSHDSVFLARRVFEMYQSQDIASLRGLDLCAGCGVIGLEFLFHCRKEHSQVPQAFDFLEVQSETYQVHFAKNIENLAGIATELSFVPENYNVLTQERFQNFYDLILCNPPYFFAGQGTLSPSEFKNRCRFFLDSDFANLIKGIQNSLKPEGKAYLLLREQTQHGWSAFQEAAQLIGPRLRISHLGDIRGTSFVEIHKP
ncbi:MAG: RsmD family RNA methyltransferase [Bdellovibrio sp.]|nr:RsmD family RNA methyltransferase [Bdellovibrio sp.]